MIPHVLRNTSCYSSCPPINPKNQVNTIPQYKTELHLHEIEIAIRERERFQAATWAKPQVRISSVAEPERLPTNHHEPNALSPSTSTQVAPATRHHLRHHSLLYPSPLRLRSLQQPRWRSRARRQVLPSSTTSDAVSCLLLCRSHLPHCLYRTMRRRRATAGCWLIRSGRGSVREWGWRWTGKVTEGEEVRVVAVAEMTTRMTFE